MFPEAAELADLLALVAGRDRKAFARLYKATNGKLFGIIRRLLGNQADAEDALQDTYLAAWANASKYKRSVYSPISWLAIIARNRAIDKLRKLHREPTDWIDDFPSLIDGGMTPEANALSHETTRQMSGAISHLKPRPGALVRDAYFEGYSYLELAAMYGMPLNTVRTTLRRSLSAMRTHVSIAEASPLEEPSAHVAAPRRTRAIEEAVAVQV